MNRTEILTRGTGLDGEHILALAEGVRTLVLATGAMGSRGLTTALTRFQPGATLPYHKHEFSEVIVVLEGEADVTVEGRTYRVTPFDALHLPQGTAHTVRNPHQTKPALLHSSFASDVPTREAVEATFPASQRIATGPDCPESLVRFATSAVYELAPQSMFRDLFAKRFGSKGVCGGYGVFAPGSSLPCHVHGYDESITIVEGTAICQVAGKEYEVGGYDTACIPTGRPHRFLNRSQKPMAMVWVYAGDEPDRTIIDSGYCEGLRPMSELSSAST